MGGDLRAFPHWTGHGAALCAQRRQGRQVSGCSISRRSRIAFDYRRTEKYPGVRHRALRAAQRLHYCDGQRAVPGAAQLQASLRCGCSVDGTKTFVPV